MTDPALAHSTDNGRYYTRPSTGREVPSITNIKDVMGIDALKFWAANECADYAADNIKNLVNLARDDIFALVKKAPFSKRGKKATSSLIGDIVHHWIDQVAKGTPVKDIDTSFYVDKWTEERKKPPVQAIWTWNAFKKFLDVYKPEWVLSEFTVWSETHGYAGTMDWAAKIGRKRILTLGDNKTGGRVYPDMALQLAAGQYADFILTPDPDSSNGWRESDIPKFDGYAILHLRPRGMELVPMYNIEKAFKAFIGLRAAFEWKVECKDNTVGTAPKYEVRVTK